MAIYNRRQLFQTAVAAAALRAAAQTAPRGKMRLGVILGISPDPEAAIRRVRDLGFPTCQVSVHATDNATVAALRGALDKYHVEATSAVCSGPGPEVYDFYQGPLTIGLVPRQYRQARIAHMKEVSDFARKAGIPAVQGHCGFIPENPNDPLYGETVEAIRAVAEYCKKNGQNFRCETGQETPITLVRAIREVGLDNVGVNFDAANLILYGKANPVDAVEVLGPYIQGVHAKDGLYPTDPKKLGAEVPIGEGMVNFPALIAKLKKIGYQNPLTIEREISGEKQTADLLAAKAYLEKLIG
ncbi:MAG: sugar phosphate isomerase/epimerase family protein [Bryobacteraceae bacterium]|jgi:sugar phosphate isomerase/epimerase